MQKAIQAVNTSYDRANGRLEVILETLQKHGQSVGEELEYVWRSGEKGLLDAAFAAANDFVYLDERELGFPTYQVIATGKTKAKFNEPWKLYVNRYKRIKQKFQSLWNGAFKNVFRSQRSDGKGGHKRRRAWRAKWQALLTSTTTYPSWYFVGYLQEDQKAWEMSKIWGSKAEMLTDTGYPPGGKE